ncbi:MAG: FkbM family methyltransferase [Caldilinea sp.]
MIKPHKAGAFNRIAKRLTPFVSLALANRRTEPLTRLFETYLAIVQGRGSGTGWDMTGEVRVATNLIRRDDAVVFDVGANMGEWSDGLRRKLLNVRCHIYQFEPASACVRELQRRRHPLTIVTPMALAAQPGERLLYSAAPGSPQASLTVRRDTYHQTDAPILAESVAVTTLALALRSFAITQLDFLKIDVEGHELEVLQGADDLLHPDMIRAISFEFGSGNINTRTFFHDFWDLLHPLGYRFARILPGGRLLPVHEYYEDLEYFRSVSNYLAAAPELMDCANRRLI